MLLLTKLYLLILGAAKSLIFFIKLSKKFKGKNCYVLGSAPHGNLKKYKKNMLLVTSSGSAKLLSILGKHKSDLSILDCEIFTDQNKSTRNIITKNKLLKNLDLGLLVQAQSNNSKFGNPELLEAKFYKHVKIDKFMRKIIIFWVTKNIYLENRFDSKISSGIFSIILCFFLGSKSVTFSGFSTTHKNKGSSIPEHFYKKYLNLEITDYKKNKNDHFKFPRSHSAADLVTIGLLFVSGKKIFTEDSDFIPSVYNRGI